MHCFHIFVQVQMPEKAVPIQFINLWENLYFQQKSFMTSTTE